MLTPEQTEAQHRTERAQRAAELARLRRRRRGTTRRRAADALRSLAERLEPRRPDPATRSARSGRPELARPRA